MDFTPEENERLKREWKTRAEICRRARQKEHSAFVQTIRQVAVSIVASWLFVFVASAWVVSFVLPFKPMEPGKTLASVPRDRQNGVFHQAEAFSHAERSVLALRR
jgi:hypothetical protein